MFESWKARAANLESEVYALYLAYRDSRTPLAAKGLIALVVAYAVSPIDPIPDVIPVLGYLDDVVVMPAGVALAYRLIPDEIIHDCRERAEDEIDVGRARWIVAGIVLLIWVLIALLAIRTLKYWF